MTHVITDARDEAQIAKATKEERAPDAGLAHILSDRKARAFMWHVIDEICHVNVTSVQIGDPHLTAFNEGARQVGVALMNRIKDHDIEQWVTMLREAEQAQPAATPTRRKVAHTLDDED